MKIFLEDDELEEIKPISDSDDRGKVILPTIGKRGENLPTDIKEIIAIDTIEKGPTEAAAIHGVPISSASKYSNGLDIANPDARARVLGMRHQIHDLAIVKLMDTLNLIKPAAVVKPRDQITLMTGLTKVVDSMIDVKKEEKPQVHLHMWCPEQKTENDYPIIDVSDSNNQ